MNQRVQTLIQQLQLIPHPEGGWYRELHRSQDRVQRQDGAEALCLDSDSVFCCPPVLSVAGIASSVPTKPGRILTGPRSGALSVPADGTQGCDVMP